jgi:hypothetical protein
VERKNVSYLYSQQTINIEGLPDGKSGSLWLQVMVFETPEIAVDYCKDTLKDYSFNQETYEGYSPGYNGIKDPRLDGGVGASSDDGKFIQYKNAVIRIEELGSVDTVRPYMPQLAKLWIDKVSKIR